MRVSKVALTDIGETIEFRHGTAGATIVDGFAVRILSGAHFRVMYIENERAIWIYDDDDAFDVVCAKLLLTPSSPEDIRLLEEATISAVTRNSLVRHGPATKVIYFCM